MQAAVPYFDTLQAWIYRGVIQDPCLEFLVQEMSSKSGREVAQPGYSDFYWQDRYSLIHDRIPSFLQEVGGGVGGGGGGGTIPHSSLGDGSRS